MRKYSAIRNVGVFTLALLLLWCHARAQQMQVAVWDFDNYEVGGASAAPSEHLSRALSEVLIEQLLRYPGAQVVERNRLREILDEQKLGSSALADESARLRLGRIAGARQMVFGSLMRIGEMTRIDVRLVSVATSEVLAAHELSGTARDLVGTLQDVARELVQNLMGNNAVGRDGRDSRVDSATLARFDNALALMDRKDFAAAIEVLKSLLQKAPDFTPAERQIAIALEQLSRQ